MNIAVIFAGGVGSRMKTTGGTPKQFLNVHGKPIIIHTLEKFQENENIDAITIACVDGYIDYLWKLVKKYDITKVKAIVKGGKNGQESIYNGLKAAKEISDSNDDIVLIHDGVRPLIGNKLIDDNIATVKKYGNAITCVECKETVVTVDNDNAIEGTNVRANSRIARAPQSFKLNEIFEIHNKAKEDGYTEAIDSCSLMKHYNKKLNIVMGSSENIKITTPDDYYIFKALLESKENSDLFA